MYSAIYSYTRLMAVVKSEWWSYIVVSVSQTHIAVSHHRSEDREGISADAACVSRWRGAVVNIEQGHEPSHWRWTEARRDIRVEMATQGCLQLTLDKWNASKKSGEIFRGCLQDCGCTVYEGMQRTL